MRKAAALLVVAIAAGLCACRPAGVRFKAAYLDMDGTTLDSKGKVPKATAEALAEYVRCGGRYGIASGRSPDQVAPYIGTDLHPDLPLVLHNGAILAGPGRGNPEVVAYLELAAAIAALAAAESAGGVTGAVVHWADHTAVGPSTPDLEAFLEGHHFRIDERCPDLGACISRRTGPGPLKVLFVVDEALRTAFAAALDERVRPDARAVATSPRTVEVVPAGVNKAAAIRTVLARYGLEPSDVVVFGDGSNDREMLSQFPVGVAMGNCHPDACGAALVRIGGNDTGAVADTIRCVLVAPGCAAARTPCRGSP